MQAGIDTLNGNSGALTGGSARVRAALTQMQTALNGISASTDELNTPAGCLHPDPGRHCPAG